MNNENTKVWERIKLSDNAFNTYDILTFDLNGDGKLDIIESNSDELNLFYFNRYMPKFP